jgi:NADH-ubiquinone oxidoreductase chain 6
MEMFLHTSIINTLLPFLAIIAALFVITTQNPIYSVFNLIVLYILVAFFLIFKGITYIGISYIVIYIGAIAILFLFILMLIDIEVVEKRNNNYLPLFFLLLGGSVFLLKNLVVKFGLFKINNSDIESDNYFINLQNKGLNLEGLFHSSFNNSQYRNEESYIEYLENYLEGMENDINNLNFFENIVSDNEENINIGKEEIININSNIMDFGVLNGLSTIQDLFNFNESHHILIIPD